MGVFPMAPCISVIIPVYNSADFLSETIESIRNQTLTDWELICVDNGSTDTSLDILKDYAGKDGRIRFLSLPPVGAGAARNAGLDVARGTYACFCDSDDLYTPNALEHLYHQAEEYRADLVISRLATFNEEGRQCIFGHLNMERIAERVNPRSFCPLKELPDMLFEIDRPGGPAKLYRREYLHTHQIRFTTHRRAEDLPFSFFAAALAGTISFSDEICYLYRQRGNSLSHNLTQEPCVFLEVLDETYQRLMDMHLPDQAMLSYLRSAVSECLYHPNLMLREDARTCWEKIRTIYEPKWNILPRLASDTHIREKYSLYRAIVAPEQRFYIDLHHGWGMTAETVRSIRDNASFSAEIILLTKGMPVEDDKLVTAFLQQHPEIRAEESPDLTTKLPCYRLTSHQALACEATPQQWSAQKDAIFKGKKVGIVRLFRFCGIERLHDCWRLMLGHKCAMRYVTTPHERALYLSRYCIFKHSGRSKQQSIPNGSAPIN